MSEPRRDPQPLLMSIEGIDGCGKTTQTRAVAAAFEQLGRSAKAMVVQAYGARTVNVLAQERTGDPFAYHPLIPAELREWVFACDVAQFTRTEFTPLFERGTTVIWDRGPLTYRTSAAIYGGLTPWVQAVQDLYPRPRTTFVLDVPVATAVERLQRRSGKTQQTDESAELLAQVRGRLLEQAESAPEVVVLDGTVAPEEVTQRIVDHWLAPVGLQ